MADTKKCSNPACSCLATKGEKFCSAHCEAQKNSLEVMCQCGHASCNTSATASA